jgi:hypothetical protein
VEKSLLLDFIIERLLKRIILSRFLFRFSSSGETFERFLTSVSRTFGRSSMILDFIVSTKRLGPVTFNGESCGIIPETV